MTYARDEVNISSMVVKASDIARFLESPLRGADITVTGVSSADSLRPHTVTFASSFMEQLCELTPDTPVLILACDAFGDRLRVPHILTHDARLSYAKVVARYFPRQPVQCTAKTNAVISESAVIGAAVVIGANSVIGSGVTIGSRTVIGSNVVVADNCVIGSDCVVFSGAIIGEDGFGFAFEDDGTPVRIPHHGRVVIHDHVEIGSNTVIYRGTIGDTVIGEYTKISGLVHIAHNVHIGQKTIVAAGSTICGSARIGSGVWIAPHAVIRNKVSVGDRAMVGLGAVVVESVPENAVVVGNPARYLRQRYPD